MKKNELSSTIFAQFIGCDNYHYPQSQFYNTSTHQFYH